VHRSGELAAVEDPDFDVADRSEPSMMFWRPLRAAWVIWSYCRPLGS